MYARSHFYVDIDIQNKSGVLCYRNVALFYSLVAKVLNSKEKDGGEMSISKRVIGVRVSKKGEKQTIICRPGRASPDGKHEMISWVGQIYKPRYPEAPPAVKEGVLTESSSRHGGDFKSHLYKSGRHSR